MFSEEPQAKGDAADAGGELKAQMECLVAGSQRLQGQGEQAGEKAHAHHGSKRKGRHVEEPGGGSLGRGHDEQGEAAAARDAVDEPDRVGPQAEAKGM